MLYVMHLIKAHQEDMKKSIENEALFTKTEINNE